MHKKLNKRVVGIVDEWNFTFKKMRSKNGREQVKYCEFEAGKKATRPKNKF